MRDHGNGSDDRRDHGSGWTPVSPW
jgi:hypothetical protein